MKKHLKSVVSFVAALGVTLSSAASMAASYSDVPNDASYAEAVASLSSIGILTGYDEVTFKPDANITRAEVATVVVRALAQEEAAISSKGVTSFTDVPADHWASGYINVASSGNNAFINGMGDGTFAPEANVTYAQVIKMLVAGIGYGDWGVSYGGYPTGYITAAKNLGITNGVSTVNADEAATRGTVAQLTYNAINTPLLSLETYSPTNPEYVVLDGTGNRDYETALTYYHNIYTVEGRVIMTNKSSGGTLEAGKVRYQIENTKNYGEDTYIVKRSEEDTWFSEEMYVGDTDAADYLNVYSKALVYVDADEEATILSIVASGKNQIVELDTKGWDDEYYDSKEIARDKMLEDDGKNQIWFYSDGSKKGKSSRYYLADEFTMYVNGVKVDDVEEGIEEYIFKNEVGKITLVDTPSEGSVSTDGKYDAMFISYYGTAIVDSTTSDKIYFDDKDAVLSNAKSEIEFEWDDDDYSYTFTMDGKEISFEDIKEGDVLSIAYDVTAAEFKDSTFYDIIVSRNIAEGKVVELNDEDGEIGIGDEMYSLVDGLTGTKDYDTGEWDLDIFKNSLGTSYTVYLDAFNRIVDSEKLASTVKYGIVHRAWYDDNSEERKVTLYDTSAASKTLIVNEDMDEWDDLLELTYNSGNFDENGNYSNLGSGAPSYVENTYGVEQRVITYETNSKGEIKSFKKLTGSGKYGEYKKSSNKIGSLSIGDSTVIISKGDESKTDYNLVNKSSLIDGNEYAVFGYDKDNSTYPFMLIVDGIGSYNADTRFAVVEKVTQGQNDAEDDCHKISLYTAGSKDLQVLNTDEKDDNEYGYLVKGDVIVFKTNANGEITEVKRIFSAEEDISNYNDFVTEDRDDVWFKDYTGIIEKWDNDEDVELYCGPVIDKTSSSITIATKADTEKDIDDDDVSGELVVNIDDLTELDYADDIAIYVYDLNNSKSERLYVGTASSVTKPSIPKSYKQGRDNQYVDLAELDIDGEIDFTIAFAKTVDDEVTDLFIIIPKK
ncbi:MAG: S-layer homology domain-containing protein [Oscillospiraceae bacterium]|nr:S-layer homology domain-containing protein [Oscillospiraceae bacterium]